MLGVVLAENEVAQAVVLIHNGQSVELVLPNDVVGLLERGGGGSSDELSRGVIKSRTLRSVLMRLTR